MYLDRNYNFRDIHFEDFVTLARFWPEVSYFPLCHEGSIGDGTDKIKTTVESVMDGSIGCVTRLGRFLLCPSSRQSA